MSARAAWRLEGLGFTAVYRYTAGKADWFAGGLPLAGARARIPRFGDLARRDLPICGLQEHLGEVLLRGYDPAPGACARSCGEKVLDAANLLLPLVHFIDARDPRMRATVEATERGLMADRLVYRYADAEDGLPGGEATFGGYTFWLVYNLTALGRVKEARALFERTPARATPLGMYAEELDPLTGAHPGTFPQALTHTGLITPR